MDEVQEVLKEECKIPFLKILYKNLIYIIIVTILCGAVGAVFGKYVTRPIYTAQCNLVLNVDLTDRDIDGSANNNNTIAKSFLPTILYSIKNDANIFIEANDNYENRTTNGSISSKSFSTSSKESSVICTLLYADVSEEVAKEKLAEIIKSVKNYVKTKGTTLVQASSVSMVETQKDYTVNVSDSFVMYVLVGIAGGLILSAAFFLLLYILDNKVKYPEEIEELTGTSVLAYIENKE